MMKKYRLFFTGLGMTALVIGMLTGLSYSPVVATVVPLLFTLVTAGGVFLRRKEERDGADSSLPVFTPKGHGLALIVFSMGFAIGIYAGVGAKLHWKKLWFGGAEPAFAEVEITDFRILAAAVEAEQRLVDAGVETAQRKAIFSKLFSSMAERETARRNVIKAKRLALEKINDEKFTELTQAFDTLSSYIDEAYNQSNDFDESTYEALGETLQLVKEITKIEVIEEIEFLEFSLSEAELKLESSPMLSEEEIEALTPLLPKTVASPLKAEPFRVIASDEKPFLGFKEG